MKSVMQHNFSQVPKVEVPRSVFNRTHGHKTTFDAGYLVPFYIDEALPGDTFNVKSTLFARLATPIYPLMDNLYMDVHYFAVPLRLVWNHWQQFCGEDYDPDSPVDYVTPKITSPAVTGWATGSLADYFGLPVGKTDVEVNSFFFRAYNLIWNEWYRCEYLQDKVVVDTDDGPDSPADYVLLRRGKRHDYFTSCLPWPQRGPGIELPLGTSAPIIGTQTAPVITSATEQFTNAQQVLKFRTTAGALPSNTRPLMVNTSGQVSTTNASTPISESQVYPSNLVANVTGTGLTADLSAATASNINALREAFQLQRMYERDARGGTRYTEILRAHFGVVSPDARLQRPEYLGGGGAPVVINPLAQTSESATTPLATLGGIGTITARAGFTKSFVEHCVIIGLVSVRADLTYQQGLNRMWSRSTRFDYYWPALAHLGEQAVLSKEIYMAGNGTMADDDVFGYQERWAEYRYKPSQITGKFRSEYAQSLDAWHLSQEFGTRPYLDEDFIVENPPMTRVLAVGYESHFLFDSFIDIKCARPMPVYSVPGLIDHF